MPRTIVTRRPRVRNFGSCISIAGGTQRVSWGNIGVTQPKVFVTAVFVLRYTSSSNFDVQLGYSTNRWFFILNGNSRQLAFNIRISGVEKGSGYTTSNLELYKKYQIMGWYDPNGGANNLVCEVYDKDTMALVSSKATTQTGALDTTVQSLIAGFDPLRGNPTNNQFDDILIMDRIPSAQERLDIVANKMPDQFDADNVNHYVLYAKCDEGSGTSLADSSGNQNVGTLIGATFSPSIGLMTAVRSAVAVPRQKIGQFTPDTAPELRLWLAADRITGLSNGAAVAQWDDLSGRGNHATQGTGSRQPTFVSGTPGLIGGKPFLSFDGGDWLDVANESDFDIPFYTLYIVTRRTSGSNQSIIAKNVLSGDASRRKLQIAYAGNLIRYQAGADGVFIDKAITPGDWNITCIVGEGNSAHSIDINDSLQDFSSALNDTSFNNGPLSLGAAFGNGAEGFIGHFAECIVAATNHGDVHRQGILRYLGEKYSLPITQVTRPVA